MLVFSRKQGERFMIGDTIIIDAERVAMNEVSLLIMEYRPEMLVIEHNVKVGEKVDIAKDVFIKLIGTDRGQARFGISAPRDTPIHREEIYKKVMADRFAG